MNLCTNAGHAMRPQGGILEVQLHPTCLRTPLEIRSGTVSIGEHLRLTVRDTGCGMDAALLERIFLPFFTTKLAGDGTGLGLSIVQGILVELGGGIDVESQPGKGSTFTLYLPSQDGEAPPEPLPSPLRSGRGEQILVVDDESSIRSMMEEVLSTLGYGVTLAASGSEAMELLAEATKPFDLVLTDVTMPDLSGPEVVERIQQSYPDLPCRLMSGNPLDAEGVLRKPVSLKTLDGMLRDVFG